MFQDSASDYCNAPARETHIRQAMARLASEIQSTESLVARVVDGIKPALRQEPNCVATEKQEEGLEEARETPLASDIIDLRKLLSSINDKLDDIVRRLEL